jgi:hypothetical protein
MLVARMTVVLKRVKDFPGTGGKMLLSRER